MLPIPDANSDLTYGDICTLYAQDEGEEVQSLGPLVSQLSRGRISAMDTAHLDPDLWAGSMPRLPGWRPLFGQRGAALGHLRIQSIGPGDLFLFYGWFREVVKTGGAWAYRRNAPDLHVLFGWLQVDCVLDIQCAEDVPSWATTHPHADQRFCMSLGSQSNALYIARPSLQIPTVSRRREGGGMFPFFTSSLQLSADNHNRSLWLLPAWMMPQSGKAPLTYHRDTSRWSRHPQGVLLQTVGRGQEFVLNCDEYPDALSWLQTLFNH